MEVLAQQKEPFEWVLHKPWKNPLQHELETTEAKTQFVLDTIAGPLQPGFLWIEWKKEGPHDLIGLLRVWAKSIHADVSEWTTYEQKVKTTDGKRLLLQGQHIVLNYFEKPETMAMYSIHRNNKTLLILGKGTRSYLTVVATINFIKSLEYLPIQMPEKNHKPKAF
jgi:hypothetical protein